MRTYVFKEQLQVGDSTIYVGRIEVWTKNQVDTYTKYFTDEVTRQRWLKDKQEVLELGIILDRAA